jgi:hypothetical protein
MYLVDDSELVRSKLVEMRSEEILHVDVGIGQTLPVEGRPGA